MTPIKFKKKGGVDYITLSIPTIEEAKRVWNVFKERGSTQEWGIMEHAWNKHKENTVIIFTQAAHNVGYNPYHGTDSSNASIISNYKANHIELEKFFDLYEIKEIDFDGLLKKLQELENKLEC